jgi:thiol-disulfide isomerase/thioredoxin
MAANCAGIMRRGWLVGLVVAGLVVVALVLAVVMGGGGGESTMPENVTVELTGTPLPEFAGDPTTDAGLGLAIPTMLGRDFAGAPVEIGPDDGPAVVLFLAHWCPHCQAEVPAIQSYLATNEFPAEVRFISVATSYSPSRPNWPPSDWLEREGWTIPTLVDDAASTAFVWFGAGAFPYFVFVDSTGAVALRASGEIDPADIALVMQELAGT